MAWRRRSPGSPAATPCCLSRAVAGRATTDGWRALDHVIERSLGALSPEHRDVVALAAILGVDGALADVVAMVGGDPPDVIEALERAVVRRARRAR